MWNIRDSVTAYVFYQCKLNYLKVGYKQTEMFAQHVVKLWKCGRGLYSFPRVE